MGNRKKKKLKRSRDTESEDSVDQPPAKKQYNNADVSSALGFRFLKGFEEIPISLEIMFPEIKIQREEKIRKQKEEEQRKKEEEERKRLEKEEKKKKLKQHSESLNEADFPQINLDEYSDVKSLESVGLDALKIELK